MYVMHCVIPSIRSLAAHDIRLRVGTSVPFKGHSTGVDITCQFPFMRHALDHTIERSVAPTIAPTANQDGKAAAEGLA